MRFIPLLAALLLPACTTSLPHPQTLPPLSKDGQWFKLEQTNAAGQTVQTNLLAVEPHSDGIRFVQTDVLGAPVSRQSVSTKGWKNDGFVMPNASSRRLFAALLPLWPPNTPPRFTLKPANKMPHIKDSALTAKARCSATASVICGVSPTIPNNSLSASPTKLSGRSARLQKTNP